MTIPRVLLALGVAALAVGCDWLVGIGDLPARGAGDARAEDAEAEGEADAVGAIDVGAIDVAAVDVAAVDVRSGEDALSQDVATADGPARDGSADGGTPDHASAPDASAPSDAPTDSPAADRVLDQAAPGADATDGRGTEDAAARDAGEDAPSCPLRPSEAGMACAICLQSQCCGALAACEAPDDAGLDDAGESACVRLTNVTIICIVAVGDPSSACTQADQSSPAVQQTASSLTTCFEQTCQSECANLIAIPGF